MKLHENRGLVKHIRKQVKLYGFRNILQALAEIADAKRGKAMAQWGFLAHELRETADDEVPE